MKNALLIFIAFLSVVMLVELVYLSSHLVSNKAKIKVSDFLFDIKIPESQCKLQEPIYTDKEIDDILLPVKYSPICRTESNDSIKISGFSIYAQCEAEDPEYFTDPGLPQKLGGEVKDLVTWQSDYHLSENSEFALIKCANKSIYAFAFNRFNESVAEKANEKRFQISREEKNFNVFLLVFDSISRHSSYRFLKKFTELMRKGKNKGLGPFNVYEIPRMGVPEPTTVTNMPMILYGEHLNSLRRKLGIFNELPKGTNRKYIDLQTEKSIWSYYSKLGYTTLFLSDTVWDYVAQFTGRDIEADHVFTNFWRHAWSVYGWHDFSPSQRCVGLQNSHNLSFTYIYEYFQNYKENNKFAYVHLDAAHEWSGNLATIDQDLADFVSSLLNLMKNRDENLAFFILSDHGWNYKELAYDPRYHSEMYSPFTYLILSKEVESDLGASENLMHNSEQLLGRFDLNFALKYLAHYPSSFSQYEGDSELGLSYENSAGNIFTEKISENRTCEMVGSPDEYCMCTWFKDFNINDSEEKKTYSNFFSLLEKYFEIKEASGCKKLENFEVKKGKKFRMSQMGNSDVVFYDLEFLVNEDVEVSARFINSFYFNIGAKFYLKKGDLNPIKEYEIAGKTFFDQLVDLKIKGKCENECLC